MSKSDDENNVDSDSRTAAVSSKNMSTEEDLIGTDRLQLSDSDHEMDCDDVEASTSSKATAPTQGDTLNSSKDHADESEQPAVTSKRMKRIVDSDTDDGEGGDGVMPTKQGAKEKLAGKPPKISALIDTDSEEEPETDTAKDPKVRNKISRLVDSDSESDMERGATMDTDKEEEETTTKSENNKKDKKEKKAKKEQKSKKEQKDKKDQKEKKKAKKEIAEKKKEDKEKKKEKFSSLVDSESESEPGSDHSESARREDGASSRGEDDEESEDVQKKTKKPKEGKANKPMRASAKKALDEMQAIQSEQQRLHREAHITIPYHKPKKHTLQEFLKRRTIIRPASPAAALVQSKPLKMTGEDLEQFAHLMEERAKEATEFFKSESEEEEEDEQKENEQKGDGEKENEQKDDEEKEDGQNDRQKEVEENEDGAKEYEPKWDKQMEDEKDQAEQATNDSPMELAHEFADEMPSCSRAVITEVLELPKLDLQELHLTEATPTEFVHTPKTAPAPAANVKRLISEGQLHNSPTLKGDPNMLIDLDTGDLVAPQPTGVQNLMERLLLTNKHKKHKSTETINILSTENGKVEMSKIIRQVQEENDPHKEQKPGAAYVKLKENLKSLITQKRLKDIKRKKEEEHELSRCMGEEDEEEEDGEGEEYEPESKPKKAAKDILIDEEEGIHDAEEYADEEAEEEVEEDVEEEEEMDEKPVIKSEPRDEAESDEEEEAMDDDEDEEEDEEDEEDDEEEAADDKSKRKNRIIKAFQDDSDDEELMGPPPPPPAVPITMPSLYAREPDTQQSATDAESELLSLCSGQFEPTQASTTSTEADSSVISQIPMTQYGDRERAADELLGLCSGKFEDEEEQTPKPTVKKIVSSDEEDGEGEAKENMAQLGNSAAKQPRKKLTKRQSKRKAKLGFSDDEEEDDDEQQPSAEAEEEEKEAEEEEEGEEENEEDQPETYVDYDSDENEVVVQLTKRDRVMKAQNFVENEAELSESEWGSADEDEQHMDRYDIELGDEDDFDKDQLRTELGQIHARKMLDEDIREVRKLQEMLFEDETEAGAGRQRQFKWKNAELGFSLDDSAAQRGEEAGSGGEDDDENEHMWRKLRFEREQLLRERGLKVDDSDEQLPALSTTTTSSSSAVNVSMVPEDCGTAAAAAVGPKKKLNIITASSVAKRSTLGQRSSDNPFLISKTAAVLHKKTVRGSFLVRDKETLSKLAGLTRGGSAADGDATAGTVANKAVKSKNFVFASLTEEEHASRKRKAGELLNNSQDDGVNFMKKPRIEPRRDKCLIDQLL